MKEFGMEPGYETALGALPQHLQPGIRRYLEHGIMPGSFLCSVIDNDLGGAVCRAAGISLEEVKAVYLFFYNYCPSDSHGSKAKRLMWVDKKTQAKPS